MLIGADLHTDFVFAASKQMIQLWAILLQSFHVFLPSGYPAKILMAGDYGCLWHEDQRLNMQAFSAYLHTYAPSIETVLFQGSDPCCQQRDPAVSDGPSDTYAIYTCSARFTYHISQCIRQLGIQDRIQVIGNDLFTESRQALSDGILRGVIDKKISKQSALAVKTLFDYLLKKDYPRSSCLVMEPEIVLRSNFQSHSDLQK